MKENVTAYDALEISKEWLEQPMFNKVIITLNTENSLDSLDLSDNAMSQFQYIIAKGKNVTSVEVGDKVRLSLDKMTSKKVNPNNTHEDITTIELDPIEFDGKIFAIIEDRLIKTRFTNSKELQTNE
jgi:hypothetical protein